MNSLAHLKGKKVYLGMSGGVDSSVSAALLKRAGAEVTGVFIKVWQPDWFPCTAEQDRLDAMRVAALLDIPFVTLDLEQEYKKHVVDYMIGEYQAGRTPNPDVMCNKYVKFGGFFRYARAQGAEFVATGHYAQTRVEDGVTALLKGDEDKDQSYFLWTLTTEQLASCVFPVGDLPKEKVRSLARSFKLPVAEKRDSQGLCFVGKIDMKEFLLHYIERQKGNVLDVQDRVIGTHDGALFYTLGERHGFRITSKTPQDSPYFVCAKNIEANTITVSHDKPQVQMKSECTLTDVVWRDVHTPKDEVYQVRTRYRQALVPARITMSGNNSCQVHFLEQGEVATAGQSCVIYRGEVCVGGGIIA
jgi:tRNA-specific 2-thiouridylase